MRQFPRDTIIYPTPDQKHDSLYRWSLLPAKPVPSPASGRNSGRAKCHHRIDDDSGSPVTGGAWQSCAQIMLRPFTSRQTTLQFHQRSSTDGTSLIIANRPRRKPPLPPRFRNLLNEIQMTTFSPRQRGLLKSQGTDPPRTRPTENSQSKYCSICARSPWSNRSGPQRMRRGQIHRSIANVDN